MKSHWSRVVWDNHRNQTACSHRHKISVINPRSGGFSLSLSERHESQFQARNKGHRSSGEFRWIPKKFPIQIPRAARGLRPLENRETRSRSSSKARYKSDGSFAFEFRLPSLLLYLFLSLSARLSLVSIFFFPPRWPTCSPTRNYQPSTKNFRLPPLLPGERDYPATGTERNARNENGSFDSEPWPVFVTRRDFVSIENWTTITRRPG